MLRCFLVFLLSTASLLAQSPLELLQRTAEHYATADTYKVNGTASALIPNTSWRFSYAFEAQGIQPVFFPLDQRSSPIKDLEQVGSATHVRIDPKATDEFPKTPFSMHPFGTYHWLTKRLIGASQTGSETVTVDGRAHACIIIDATYDYSPEFRPNSVIAHKKLWVDPKELVVLREKRTLDGLDWTAQVTTYSFGQPVSAETLETLQSRSHQLKERPEWQNRTLPDLTLQQISGPPIRLADLRGKPVLLDFWGSYCAPCKPATLHAQELARRYRASGLAVITVTQDNAADAGLWANHNHIDLPIVLDPDQQAFKAFDIEGIPITIFADQDGKIVHYWTGFEDESGMDAAISSVLAMHTNSPAVATHMP